MPHTRVFPPWGEAHGRCTLRGRHAREPPADARPGGREDRFHPTELRLQDPRGPDVPGVNAFSNRAVRRAFRRAAVAAYICASTQAAQAQSKPANASGDAKAAAPQKPGLYIAPLIASGKSSPGMPARVLDAVHLGYQSAGADSKYSIVSASKLADSEQFIRRGSKEGGFRSYLKFDLGTEVASAHHSTMAAFGKDFQILRVIMAEDNEHALRVELELYQASGGTVTGLLRRKTIGICGEANADVLDRVRKAVFRIVTQQTNDPPSIAVVGGVERLAPLGTEIVVDACATRDPDEDALVWKWEQRGGPSVVAAGYEGRRLLFAPTLPGIYEFNLSAVEAIAPPEAKGSDADEALRRESAAARVIKVEVAEPPTARPDSAEIVEFNPEAAPLIRLDATGAGPTNAHIEWRQIGGPPVTLIGTCSGDLQTIPKDNCVFVPRLESLYSFELSVSTRMGRARSTAKFLLAGLPQVHLGAQRGDVLPGRVVELSRSVVDGFDRDPQLHWSATTLDPRGRTERQVPIDLLVDSGGRRAKFYSDEEGDYQVTLSASANRALGDLQMTSTATRSADIRVRRPSIKLNTLWDVQHSRLGNGAQTSAQIRVGLGALVPEANPTWRRFMMRASLPLYYARGAEADGFGDRVFRGMVTVGTGARALSSANFDGEAYLEVLYNVAGRSISGGGVSQAVAYRPAPDGAFELYGNVGIGAIANPSGGYDFIQRYSAGLGYGF